MMACRVALLLVPSIGPVLTYQYNWQIFKHTFGFFRKYGHEPHEAKLQVSLGKGKDGFWINCFPSNLVEQFPEDIRKFGKVLKIIKWTMPILGVVPVKVMLEMFFFSKGFGDKMVFPLIALFLGTGNQTANVSCASLSDCSTTQT
jgi:hypothetical protein